jgi:hypothetical protein
MAVTNHRPPASRVAAPLVALLALSSVESEAAVTFSEPFRSVSARNDKGSSHEIGTAGFGQFNESVRVDWEEYWGAPANTTGRYYAVATQDSMIGLTGIAVKGSVNGTGSYEFWGDTPLLQYSRSNFRIHISIDSPCNLYLNGTVICTLDAQGSNLDLTEMSIALSGADGDVYSRNFGSSSSTHDGTMAEF